MTSFFRKMDALMGNPWYQGAWVLFSLVAMVWDVVHGFALEAAVVSASSVFWLTRIELQALTQDRDRWRRYVIRIYKEQP